MSSKRDNRGDRGPLKKDLSSIQDTVSFVTLAPDSKPVWEPGLASEVVSRRQHKPKRPIEEDARVVCDLETVLAMVPEQQSEWLEKAFQGIPRGTAKADKIYDILTNRKFGSDLPRKIGRRMFKIVVESMLFFSEKQRYVLARKCRLARDFAPAQKKGRTRSRSVSRSRSALESCSCSRSQSRSRTRSRSPGRRRSPAPGENSGAASPAQEAEEATVFQDGSPVSEMGEEARRRKEKERHAFEERRKQLEAQQEEQKKKWAEQRKLQEERERARKARVGAAFLVQDGEASSEEEQKPPGIAVQLKFKEPNRSLDAPLPYLPSSQERKGSLGSSSNMQAVNTMGGDSVLRGALEILARGGGSHMAAGPAMNVGRRSRSRKSNRSKRGNLGGRSSFRSPTPDGKWRGQMRAARKAKMVAQLLGVNPHHC